jgi:hypothetical protein
VGAGFARPWETGGAAPFLVLEEVMDPGDEDREHLRLFVEGGYPAVAGSGSESGASAEAVGQPETPVESAAQGA